MTLVAWGPAVPDLVSAADTLAAEHGLEAEVVDLRSLVPLDMETVLASVRKTGPLRRRQPGDPRRQLRQRDRRPDPARGLRLPRRAGRPDRRRERHLAAGGRPRAGLPAERRRHRPRRPGHRLTRRPRVEDPSMVHAILMPKPGQMTEECTVIAWHKSEGDPVRKGDILFEIETDKSAMEVEAFDDGVLLRTPRRRGRDRPRQRRLRLRRRAGRGDPRRGRPAAPRRGRRRRPRPAAPAAATAPLRRRGARVRGTAPASASAGAGSVRAADRAGDQPAGEPPGRRGRPRPAVDRGHRPGRPDRRARRAGGDRGQGAAAARPRPRDRRTPRTAPRPGDPRRGGAAARSAGCAASSPSASPRAPRRSPTSRSPWPSTSRPCSACARSSRPRARNLTVTDFVLAATAQTLAEFPDVNSRTDGTLVWPRRRVHLGLAVSLPGGLVVPVIRDADRLPLGELHDRAAALPARPATGRSAPTT